MVEVRLSRPEQSNRALGEEYFDSATVLARLLAESLAGIEHGCSSPVMLVRRRPETGSRRATRSARSWGIPNLASLARYRARHRLGSEDS